LTKSQKQDPEKQSVHKYVTAHHGHLMTQATNAEECLIKTAKVIATTILKIDY
jgi:hypothetical protein